MNEHKFECTHFLTVIVSFFVRLIPDLASLLAKLMFLHKYIIVKHPKNINLKDKSVRGVLKYAEYCIYTSKISFSYEFIWVPIIMHTHVS